MIDYLAKKYGADKTSLIGDFEAGDIDGLKNNNLNDKGKKI